MSLRVQQGRRLGERRLPYEAIVRSWRGWVICTVERRRVTDEQFTVVS